MLLMERDLLHDRIKLMISNSQARPYISYNALGGKHKPNNFSFKENSKHPEADQPLTRSGLSPGYHRGQSGHATQRSTHIQQLQEI